MDVKFITTTSDRLDDLSIVNGQVIALSDQDGYFYDMGSERHPVSGIKLVESLPVVGFEEVFYIVIEEGVPVVYIWRDNDYLQVTSKTRHKVMTASEYEDLSPAEKSDGTIYFVN